MNDHADLAVESVGRAAAFYDAVYPSSDKYGQVAA